MKAYIHNSARYLLVRLCQDAILTVLPISLNSARGLCFFSSNCGRKGAVETSAIGCLVQFNLVGSRLLGCPFLHCGQLLMPNINMEKNLNKYLPTLGFAFLILLSWRAYTTGVNDERVLVMLFIAFFLILGWSLYRKHE